MATSTDLPASCPLCGRSFGLLPVLNVEAHLIAHLAVFIQLGAANSRDHSTDW